MKVRTRFAFALWRWTGAVENLFDLPLEDLRTFQLLTMEADKP